MSELLILSSNLTGKFSVGISPNGVHTELKGNYKFANNKIVWGFDV